MRHAAGISITDLSDIIGMSTAMLPRSGMSQPVKLVKVLRDYWFGGTVREGGPVRTGRRSPGTGGAVRRVARVRA